MQPPDVEPSLGHTALMTGCCDDDDDVDDEEDEDEERDAELIAELPLELAAVVPPPTIEIDDDESDGSMRRVRRPCLELLCTNMLSDVANTALMSIETVWLMAT